MTLICHPIHISKAYKRPTIAKSNSFHPKQSPVQSAIIKKISAGESYPQPHNSVIPTIVPIRTIMLSQYVDTSVCHCETDILFFGLLVDVPLVEVAVGTADSVVAMAVLSVLEFPEFWLPSPVKPGPGPAPSCRNFDAAAGISGKASLVTSQLADEGGQVEAEEVELAPPLPLGLEVLA